MQVITNLDFQLKNTAVCIGKFDGLHRGHRLLLSAAVRQNRTVVMITFVFPGGHSLYSYGEKMFLARELGVDVFIAIPVNDSFMHMSAHDFVRDILKEKCDAKEVIVGADFEFGYKRSGNVDFLEKMGKEYGFDTLIYEKIKQDGEVISSTRIRDLLKKGKMRETNSLLETPYFIQGTVGRGNQIGRTMGVPTANICPDTTKVLPPYGVYTVRLEMEDGGARYSYEGVGNLGVKPTVGDGNKVTLEVWLFHFEGNLYDRELTVYLLDFQRGEKKFPSLALLKEQIEQDVICAKRYFELEKVKSVRGD